MKEETARNVKEENTWLRLVFIILFAIAITISAVVLTVAVIIQFLTKLLTGKINEQVAAFGQNLSTYVYHVIRFLTFARDEMPWPFAPWPDGPPEDDDVIDANPTSDLTTEGSVAKAEG